MPSNTNTSSGFPISCAHSLAATPIYNDGNAPLSVAIQQALSLQGFQIFNNAKAFYSFLSDLANRYDDDVELFCGVLLSENAKSVLVNLSHLSAQSEKDDILNASASLASALARISQVDGERAKGCAKQVAEGIASYLGIAIVDFPIPDPLEVNLWLSTSELHRGGPIKMRFQIETQDKQSLEEVVCTVQIPPATQPSTVLTIPGQGNYNEGGKRGDVLVWCLEKPEKVELDVRFTRKEMAKGGTFPIRYPIKNQEGFTEKFVTDIKIPPGMHTHSTIVLKGLGNYGSEGQRGDVFVTVIEDDNATNQPSSKNNGEKKSGSLWLSLKQQASVFRKSK